MSIIYCHIEGQKLWVAGNVLVRLIE